MEERPLPLVVVVEMVVLLEADMCMKETPRAPRGGEEEEEDDKPGAGGMSAAKAAWLLWLLPGSVLLLLVSMVPDGKGGWLVASPSPSRPCEMTTPTDQARCATRRGAADKQPRPQRA